MSGAATLPKFNSLPWSTQTWNECVKASKSALRWDIKNSLKSLCKRLTEVGEECFIVTVNVNNGWVGHIGSTKGDEYMEDRPQIEWDFLQYCREGECISSSPVAATESENSDSESCTESDEGGEPEWEPDEPVPCPDQSDRFLRSHDSQKLHPSDYDQSDRSKQPHDSGKPHPTDLPETVLSTPTKFAPVVRKGTSKTKQRRKSQQRRHSALSKSNTKVQSSYLTGRQKSWSNRTRPKDFSLLNLDLQFLTKAAKKKRNLQKQKKDQPKQCPLCCQVFKHQNLYKKHMSCHDNEKVKDTAVLHCYKCKREFESKRVLYNHIPTCTHTD